MNWFQTVQGLSGCGLQVGGMAFIGGFISLCKRLNRWIGHHIGRTERVVLSHLAAEGLSYADMLLAHSPIESRLEEAMRYVRRVADVRGITITDAEVRAVVASANRVLSKITTDNHSASV